MRCIVKGCDNHSHEGGFVGSICSPCYFMLVEGHIKPSNAWFVQEIRSLHRKLDKVKILLED
jgi:hypothetical protein